MASSQYHSAWHVQAQPKPARPGHATMQVTSISLLLQTDALWAGLGGGLKPRKEELTGQNAAADAKGKGSMPSTGMNWGSLCRPIAKATTLTDKNRVRPCNPQQCTVSALYQMAVGAVQSLLGITSVAVGTLAAAPQCKSPLFCLDCFQLCRIGCCNWDSPPRKPTERIAQLKSCKGR